jgi:coronin-1B/1C/6
MSRFVRSSKFRHVFGKAEKAELSYADLKISRTAWDSNKVYGNASFVATIWEAQGGGSFAVLPATSYGKIGPSLPLYSGHKSGVLDLSFSPFNDGIIASGSEDGYAKIWEIPEGGLKETQRNELQNLLGHKRKVGTVDFHPVAENVLATSSADYTVKLWDITTGQAKVTVGGHLDLIQSFAWSYNGSQFATSSKDKHCRVFDPRSGNEIAKIAAHTGTKGARVTFLGEKELLFTCGFSRMSERQLAVWDPRNPAKALKTQNIDTSSGQLIPIYDNDTSIIFLGGKGDGNIRYYEITGDDQIVHFISDFKTNVATLGLNVLPKYCCDIAGCEVVRMLKGHTNGIMPISFTVPRKSDLFQDDLYPETPGQEPALTGDQWFSGQDAAPKKISLETGFKPKARSQPVQIAKVEEKKPLTLTELQQENERLSKRVSYLESELRKNGIAVSGAN